MKRIIILDFNTSSCSVYPMPKKLLKASEAKIEEYITTELQADSNCEYMYGEIDLNIN